MQLFLFFSRNTNVNKLVINESKYRLSSKERNALQQKGNCFQSLL